MRFHVDVAVLGASNAFVVDWCWLLCHRLYLVGCVHKCFSQVCFFALVVVHFQWRFTSAFGCRLCSTSFPGGHQVDGLPPASSRRETSHARLYSHELEFAHSGVSVHSFSVEDDPRGSNILDDSKWSKMEDHEIDSGSFQACVGVTRDTFELY